MLMTEIACTATLIDLTVKLRVQSGFSKRNDKVRPCSVVSIPEGSRVYP